MYGNSTGGLFGYSHMVGGFPGLQAQYCRIPIADNNLLVLPPENVITPAQAICLSDIMNTAWHGLELSKVTADDTVCIWGAGPIGALTAHLAMKVRGCKKVALIDSVQWRLDLTAANTPGLITINYDNIKNISLMEHLKNLFPGGGPEVAIDCVGYRYPKSTTHKVL